MASRMSGKDYDDAFAERSVTASAKHSRLLALEHALDIRKFEIHLYWTRAAYFWTFIAAALAGYGGVQTIDNPLHRTDLSVLLCSIGLVFSTAWYCANRGSKQWQENWENHVDLLEDDITGPLYKVVLRRPAPHTVWERADSFLTGPANFSVSKINQIISLYVCATWAMLLGLSLPEFSPDSRIDWRYATAVGLALLAIGLMWWRARTHGGDYAHIATRRSAAIRNAEPDRER